MGRQQERGAVVVVVALVTFFIVGIMGLVINTYIVTISINRTQNCSDSASLAGAATLYGNDLPQPVNMVTDPTPIATQLIQANGCSIDTIEFGHWDGNFTTIAELNFPPIIDESTTVNDLNNNLDFINAVRVKTNINSIGYMGFDSTIMSRQAVAAIMVEDSEIGVIISPGSHLVQ